MTEAPETNKGSLAKRLKLHKPTLSLDRSPPSRTPKAVQHSVFARLQAAFLPHAPSPPFESPSVRVEQPPEPPEPKYIKVRVISWNMNETLPKGDLSPLLGALPIYHPKSINGDELKIPGLSLEAQHPYHIIAVAGQECPTLMGLPLGLGGGMKWDRDDDDKRKEKKDKPREKEKPDEKGKLKKDKGKAKEESLQVELIPAGATTPKPHNHHTAGWSSILEDYFSRGIGSIAGAKPDVMSPGGNEYNSASSLALSPASDRLCPPNSSSLVPGMANKDASWTLPSGRTDVPKMGQYELLTKERLMGIYLALYVHRDVKSLVEDYSQSSVATGLIGGRLGNKGGVAISLKFNGATFLFMNAHLAAHDDKVALRLANMAKIKAEMDVDDFLDSSDGRKQAEDITDRFDHTFLFGDLNFRLDITRKHADWLMIQKKYSEAQEFDQLRAIMRSLGSNAFLGFHEAAIDFPPTFKYDVLRTLKGGKRSSSKRRSRRKKKKDLTEVGEEAEDPDYAPQSAVTQEDGEGPLESASMISRSTSYYSRNTREQGDGSYGSDSDSDSDRSGEKNINGDKDSGIAQKARIGVVYAALKAKEKLHAAFGSTGSLPNAPNSTHLVKGIQLQAPPLPIIKADVVRSPSRNTALSARKSAEVSSPSAAAIPKEPYKDPPKSGLVTPSVSRKTTSLDIPRKPSHDSQSNAQLARSITAKSPSVSKTTLTLHEVKDAEQSLDIEDKGVYDTSSKQRVPSWCDRILFKTTVEIPPTPIEEEPPSIELPLPPRRSTPKMAGFFNPFKHKQRQDSVATVTKGSSTKSPVTMESSKGGSGDSAQRKKRGANGELAPLTVITSRATQESPVANSPSPDKAITSLKPLESGTLPRRVTSPNVPNVSSAGPTTGVKTTKTGTIVPKQQHQRRRSLSATIPRPKEPGHEGLPKIPASASVPPVQPLTYIDGSPIISTKFDEPPNSLASPGAVPTSSGGGVGMGFRRIFSLLPRSFGSPQPTATPDTARLMLKEEGPKDKVFKRGEVRCLEYSTLSDREMRQLEGRSDHRPVIGHFAVYL